MSKMSKESYQELVRENVEWLKGQERCLERDHLIVIAEHSIDQLYIPDHVTLRHIKEAEKRLRDLRNEYNFLHGIEE